MQQITKVFSRVSNHVRWIRTWKRLPVLAWLKGAECFQRGEYRTAAKFYSAGLLTRSSHPASAAARFDLARCYVELEDLDKAISELQYLVLTGDANQEAFLILSEIQSRQGLYLSAALTLKRAERLWPEDIEVLSELVHVLVSGDSHVRDLLDIRTRLLRLKAGLDLEDDRRLMCDTAMSEISFTLGEFDKGEALIQRVLVAGQPAPRALFIQAEHYFREGRMLPARMLLGRVLEHCPFDLTTITLLARTYLFTADEDDDALNYAHSLAEQACRMSNWKSSAALSLLSEVYEQRSDLLASLMLLKQANEVPSCRQLPVQAAMTIKARLEQLEEESNQFGGSSRDLM